MSDAILQFAHDRNVTKIVVGKPRRRLWTRILIGSIVDALVQGSGDIDIYVISAEREHQGVPQASVGRRAIPSDWVPYGWAMAVVALATGAAWLTLPFFELANQVMVYLLGIVIVATRYGRGPSLMASILSVAVLDFLFVPPVFTFAVSDVRYLFTFAVMLLVGLVTSSLAARIRTQADTARLREQRTAALYAMSRELASTRGVDQLLTIAVRHISEVFRSQVVVLLPGAGGLVPSGGAQFALDSNELGVAKWVHEHHQPAGLGTATLPGAAALYLPLQAPRGPVGVLGVRPADPHSLDAPDQLHQLETFANQTALAIERAQLADEAQQAQVRMETERLRNSLLSSVSHDLRTPLATITGAASTILESGSRLDAQTRQELLESVREEADRLNRLVQNLLEMIRLESGALQLRREWHPLEEVIGAALSRLGKELADRRVDTRVPPDLPLVPIDDVLVEQVLDNLLDNAVKYTPGGSPIRIIATSTGEAVTVEVADHGPGLPRGDEDKVFEKFYRGLPGGRGAGLGLAISQGIVKAHGGHIWAQNR